MPDRLKMQLMLDVAAFGVLRAEKFPACRQIIKKRADFHLRARRVTTVADNVDLAAVDDNFRAGNRVRLACRQAKTRNTGDARQSFTAKSKRGDGGEIVSASNFTGRVTLERKERVIAVHSTTVVNHSDE